VNKKGKYKQEKRKQVGVSDYVGDDSPHAKTQNNRPVGGVAAYP